MKWYRDNRIIGSILIVIAAVIVFFVYKFITIGRIMGDKAKTEIKTK